MTKSNQSKFDKAIATIATTFAAMRSGLITLQECVQICWKLRVKAVKVEGKANRDLSADDLQRLVEESGTAKKPTFDIAKAKASRKKRDEGKKLSTTEQENLRAFGAFKTLVSRSFCDEVTKVTVPMPEDGTKAVKKVVEKQETKAKKLACAKCAKAEAERQIALLS